MRRFPIGWALALALLLVSPLEAAPYPSSGQRTLRETLGDIDHDIRNHDAEIRSVKEKLLNHEVIIEALQKLVRKTKEETQGSNSGQADRVVQVEKALKGVSADIKQLHEHANKLAEAMNGYKEHLATIEGKITLQGKNAEHLQLAMRSLIDALELDIDTGDGSFYTIKSGDSLGQIALDHKTSIKKIKELNNLKKDTIRVGQKLRMPDE